MRRQVLEVDALDCDDLAALVPLILGHDRDPEPPEIDHQMRIVVIGVNQWLLERHHLAGPDPLLDRNRDRRRFQVWEAEGEREAFRFN
jgi:hypothetical protein